MKYYIFQVYDQFLSVLAANFNSAESQFNMTVSLKYHIVNSMTFN